MLSNTNAKRKFLSALCFSDFELVRVDQLTGFSLTKKVICDQAFLPPKSQHLVAGYQGNMGQSTHHRLDRLQIVSVGSLRDQSTTQFHRWRSTNKLIGL